MFVIKITIRVKNKKLLVGIENHKKQLPKDTIIVDNTIRVLDILVFLSANWPKNDPKIAMKRPERPIVHPQYDVPCILSSAMTLTK